MRPRTRISSPNVLYTGQPGVQFMNVPQEYPPIPVIVPSGVTVPEGKTARWRTIDSEVELTGSNVDAGPNTVLSGWTTGYVGYALGGVVQPFTPVRRIWTYPFTYTYPQATQKYAASAGLFGAVRQGPGTTYTTGTYSIRPVFHDMTFPAITKNSAGNEDLTIAGYANTIVSNTLVSTAMTGIGDVQYLYNAGLRPYFYMSGLTVAYTNNGIGNSLATAQDGQYTSAATVCRFKIRTYIFEWPT